MNTIYAYTILVFNPVTFETIPFTFKRPNAEQAIAAVKEAIAYLNYELPTIDGFPIVTRSDGKTIVRIYR